MIGRPDGVDFVEDEEPDGEDEELPRHAARLGTWRSRARGLWRGRYGPAVVLAVVVGGVLLAVVGARAVQHGGSGGGPASAPGSTSVTLNVSTGRVVSLPQRTGSDPTRCPGLQCYASPSVPAAVRAAVRAAFPSAAFLAGETTRLVDHTHGDPLWYREVVARVGTATLTVTVQAHSAGDVPDGGSKDDGHQALTYVDAALRDWFVRLRLTDRSGTSEPFDQLSSLVDDPRLAST